MVESPSEKGNGSRRSSIGSDFSLWSDTGDLVDQLADREDPLQIRLLESLEEQSLVQPGKRRDKKQKKRVRYQSEERGNGKERHTGVVRRKEDIPIPNPPRKMPSVGERLLAMVMAPNDGPSRMHGLHGKKLMYAPINTRFRAPF